MKTLVMMVTIATMAELAAQMPQPVPSPVVDAEGKVEFRLSADFGSAENPPVLVGDWMAARQTVAMTKSDAGYWVAKVGPLPPQIYTYSYRVGKTSIVDPANTWVKRWDGGNNSMFAVPGAGPWVERDVAKGQLHYHTYRSNSLQASRRLVVYTPPAYGAAKQDRYPVLYLLHGAGDDERAWTDVGRAHHILDNLIADGKAKPMIVVMTYGHPLPQDEVWGKPNGLDLNTAAYQKDLLQDVMPMIERQYRTIAKPESRAIAGLSMGGEQALSVALSNTGTFGAVFAYSSALFPGSGKKYAPLFAAAKKLGTLWIAIGKDDFLLRGNEEFHAALEAAQVPHTYQVTEGAHTYLVWRQYLAQTAALAFTGVKAK